MSRPVVNPLWTIPDISRLTEALRAYQRVDPGLSDRRRGQPAYSRVVRPLAVARAAQLHGLTVIVVVLALIVAALVRWARMRA